MKALKKHRRRAPSTRRVHLLVPLGSGPHPLTPPPPDDPEVAAFCRLAAEILIDAARVSPTIVSEETPAHDPQLN